MGYKIINFILYRSWINFIEDIRKKKGRIFKSYESIFLLILICITIYLKSYYCIIGILILYNFIRYTTIKTLPECFYYLKYRGLKIEKTYITKIKKSGSGERKNIFIYSYLTESILLSNKNKIEQYFNTNIISIAKDKYNKRKYLITTSKEKTNNLSTNLSTILSGYGYLLNLKSDTETEFYRKLEFEIDANIKDITKLKDDISFKLKKRVSIEPEDGLFVFKIHKNNTRKHNFNKVINNIKPPENIELPVLLGINQDTGEYVFGDLKKMLNIFINGIVGSGKSCLFNGIIQSILLWGNNIQMVLVDFKYVEFNQYQDLDNTIFIYKMEHFRELLNNILIEMHKRYKLFDGGIKNISEYNKKYKANLPYILICIDELSFISSQKDKATIWKDLIQLIQMGRAAGIILISATQCPDHTQINTSFRRQVDSKIIGRLRQQSDLKICGIDSNEDITKFDIGEFLINALGVGNIKIKSLFLEGVTKGVTEKLTGRNLTENPLKLGISIFPTCQLSKKNEKGITEKIDFLKLCEDYFKSLAPGTVVPSLKEAQTHISKELTSKTYRATKEKLYKNNIIYKNTPTATKFLIK